MQVRVTVWIDGAVTRNIISIKIAPSAQIFMANNALFYI